jgi:hypothetical protein
MQGIKAQHAWSTCASARPECLIHQGGPNTGFHPRPERHSRGGLTAAPVALWGAGGNAAQPQAKTRPLCPREKP